MLAFISLSGCSIARHGPVSVSHPRINWPQPEHLSRHQPGRHNWAHSVHRYKHANKAPHVRYPQPGLAHAPSYKVPVVGEVSTGGGIIGQRTSTTGLTRSNHQVSWPARWLSESPPEPSSGDSITVQPSDTTINRRNQRPAATILTIDSLINKVN
ncbi:MAG: hypothetical protein LH609_09680 [Rudanella sp.]|nr:hypothetical protein [Rudanella sp.]